MDLAQSMVNTGWMAAVLLLVQASFGLFRLNRRILRGFHIAVGLVLLPVAFVHAWISMRATPAKFTHAVGLRLATAALLLLGVQLLFGMTLIRPPENSRSLRRLHLAVGLVIVSLASVHVLLSR
jgi:hypothetical protein